MTRIRMAQKLESLASEFADRNDPLWPAGQLLGMIALAVRLEQEHEIVAAVVEEGLRLRAERKRLSSSTQDTAEVPCV